MPNPSAAQELKFAGDFALRAKLLKNANCPELSQLYHRLSVATGLKAHILEEIEAKTIHQVYPISHPMFGTKSRPGSTKALRFNNMVSPEAKASVVRKYFSLVK